MRSLFIRDCALTLLMGPSLTPPGQNNRKLGSSTFFASVPDPGYPEAILVHKGKVYSDGPAAFRVPGNSAPSAVFEYDLYDGALLRTIQIQNQAPGPPKSLSGIAIDNFDNLYVLHETQGVVRINLITGKQSVFAAPFYPVFHSAYNPPAPYLLNDLAFDKKGNLYITDSFQATIWRVPQGGGAPQVWFQGPEIDGPFGPNGLRVDPSGEFVYFDLTFDATGAGYVFTLPTIDHPEAGDLKLFHAYTMGAGPDGFAFGESGLLYVCLAGYSQISVLDKSGNEVARYSGPAANPANPSAPLPWANPTNIAFDGHGSLVVSHASLTGLPDPSPLFAVFTVYVNDTAGTLFGADGFQIFSLPF